MPWIGRRSPSCLHRPCTLIALPCPWLRARSGGRRGGGMSVRSERNARASMLYYVIVGLFHPVFAQPPHDRPGGPPVPALAPMRSFPFGGGLGGRRTAAGIGPVYIPLAAKAGRDGRWLVPVSVITRARVIAGGGVEGVPAGAAGGPTGGPVGRASAA